ncbi:hypothetical protein [Vibrio alginolyticus]|uniref:hypothetical protein n=1 Tax=Vibrio alginolyticus TaxID=663 RepID=UPI00071F0F64|nr:hypothetical protein [Vibrio alginolyticus]ALR91687.1 hypothetical protein AT730_04500 [Vibrio alginolyticus]MBY7710561.1 hypothetical protein [Vibrio alginolyticus]
MLSKTNVRCAAILSFSLVSLWLWVSIGVFQDYVDLLNRAEVVQVSVLTLWIPVGGFGAILFIAIFSGIALVTGKNARLVIGERWTPLVNKITLYSALAGIPFAIGWTYHSLNLLDKYGYEYSDNLTKITPTGIHLIYVKSKN